MTHRFTFLYQETIMGTSLHNKIYLGRSRALAAHRVQAAVALVTCAGIALAWYVLRNAH